MASQPDIGSDPTHDLKGLRVSTRTVSLPSLASGKQGGVHHRHGERDATELELSAQPASHCLTGCWLHSQHHPSQPVMR